MAERPPDLDQLVIEAVEERGRVGDLDQPAIGIDLAGVDPDAFAGAVLRARRHGFDVIAIATTEPPAEAIDVAQELDVTVVESVAESVRESLVVAGRKAGYPGVIVGDGLGTRLDYDTSRAALFEAGDRYAVEAVTVEETSEEPYVVVGIPAYNESVAIGSVVLEARQYGNEVVVVDDGSSDATAELAREAGALVIEHGENRGKGAAMRTLFEHVRGTRFDVLVCLDGDGQHIARMVPDLLEPVVEGEADMVIGSRYISGGNGGETPRYRRFGQRVLDVLTMGSAGLRVTDSQSGFRAFSPAAIDSLDLHSDGYSVESEMIHAAAYEDLDIVETPIEVRYDGVDGSNSGPLGHGLSVVRFLLELVQDRHPLVFFALPGAVLTAVGIAYGVEGILIYRASGAFYPAKAMVSGFTTIIGVLGVFLGLVLNSFAHYVTKLNRRSDD